jgi:hypothetical protein
MIMRMGASVSQLLAVSVVPRGALMMRAFAGERSEVSIFSAARVPLRFNWGRKRRPPFSYERGPLAVSVSSPT